MEQTYQDKENGIDKVLAFDTIFTTNHLKMLKVLLSYFDPSTQKSLAVFIKLWELQYTLIYVSRHPAPFRENMQGPPDIQKICGEIAPYCSPEDKKILDKILQMQQTMENFRQMSQTMEMLKELFPDGIPGFGGGSDAKGREESGGPIGSMDLLSSMLGGENSQMFEMLAAMFNTS